METKYPEIKVKLTGEDGNAFSILGRVTREMQASQRRNEMRSTQRLRLEIMTTYLQLQ